MNPLKLVRTYELKKYLELKAKLTAAGIDAGYVDRKIAKLQGKLE